MILRLVVDNIQHIYRGVHMHNGVYTFSNCRFMNMISTLWDMHEQICTLIYLHVMQLRLPLGIALIVKAVGLTSCWHIYNSIYLRWYMGNCGTLILK